MSEYACHPSNNWLDDCGFKYEDTVFDLESERRLSSTQNAAKFHLPYSLHEASIKGFLPTFAKRTFQCRALPTSWLWTLESRHGVYCGIFHTSSNLFFSGSHDGVHVFDYSSRYLRLLEAIRCPDSHWAVVSLNLSPDDRHLVYSVLSNHVHLVNITGTHFIDQTIDIGDLSGQTYSVCFNGAGTHLIAGQENGNLSLCDIETGSWSSILASPSRQDINAVATVDPAGQVIIAAGDDTNIRVFDTRVFSQGALAVFPGHLDGITYLDSKMDRFYFLSNSKDQTIRLWDLRKHCLPGRERQLRPRCSWDYRMHPVPRDYTSPRQPHGGLIRGDLSLLALRGHRVQFTLIRARFSPAHTTGQRYVYSGGSVGGWCIWDLMTGELVHHNVSGPHLVRDVFWHQYEPVAIACQMDGALTCWHCPFKDDASSTADTPMSERSRLEQADPEGKFIRSSLAGTGLYYRFPDDPHRSSSHTSAEFADWEADDSEESSESGPDDTEYREMLAGREFSSTDEEDSDFDIQPVPSNQQRGTRSDRPRTRCVTRSGAPQSRQSTQPDEGS